jgi:hypothetical protein
MAQYERLGGREKADKKGNASNHCADERAKPLMK